MNQSNESIRNIFQTVLFSYNKSSSA